MKLTREMFVPKASIKVQDKASSAVVYIKTSEKGRLVATAFSGKRAKYDYNYGFVGAHAETRREKFIVNFFQAQREHEARKVARAAERKAAGRGLVVGNILVASWGYDQTNVDYYQVTKLIGSTMVEVREINGSYAETGFMSGRCNPIPDSFTDAEPMRRKAINCSVSIDSVRHASLVEKDAEGNYRSHYSSSYA